MSFLTPHPLSPHPCPSSPTPPSISSISRSYIPLALEDLVFLCYPDQLNNPDLSKSLLVSDGNNKPPISWCALSDQDLFNGPNFIEFIKDSHCRENLDFLLDIHQYELLWNQKTNKPCHILSVECKRLSLTTASRYSTIGSSNIKIRNDSSSKRYTSLRAAKHMPHHDHSHTHDDNEYHDLMFDLEYDSDQTDKEEEEQSTLKQQLRHPGKRCSKLEQSWNQIIDTYINEGSLKELNLPYEARHELLMEDQYHGDRANETESIHDPCILLKAKKLVLSLLRQNVYWTFIRSQESKVSDPEQDQIKTPLIDMNIANPVIHGIPSNQHAHHLQNHQSNANQIMHQQIPKDNNAYNANIDGITTPSAHPNIIALTPTATTNTGFFHKYHLSSSSTNESSSGSPSPVYPIPNMPDKSFPMPGISSSGKMPLTSPRELGNGSFSASGTKKASSFFRPLRKKLKKRDKSVDGRSKMPKKKSSTSSTVSSTSSSASGNTRPRRMTLESDTLEQSPPQIAIPVPLSIPVISEPSYTSPQQQRSRPSTPQAFISSLLHHGGSPRPTYAQPQQRSNSVSPKFNSSGSFPGGDHNILQPKHSSTSQSPVFKPTSPVSDMTSTQLLISDLNKDIRKGGLNNFSSGSLSSDVSMGYKASQQQSNDTPFPFSNNGSSTWLCPTNTASEYSSIINSASSPVQKMDSKRGSSSNGSTVSQSTLTTKPNSYSESSNNAPPNMSSSLSGSAKQLMTPQFPLHPPNAPPPIPFEHQDQYQQQQKHSKSKYPLPSLITTRMSHSQSQSQLHGFKNNKPPTFATSKHKLSSSVPSTPTNFKNTFFTFSNTNLVSNGQVGSPNKSLKSSSSFSIAGAGSAGGGNGNHGLSVSQPTNVYHGHHGLPLPSLSPQTNTGFAEKINTLPSHNNQTQQHQQQETLKLNLCRLTTTGLDMTGIVSPDSARLQQPSKSAISSSVSTTGTSGFGFSPVESDDGTELSSSVVAPFSNSGVPGDKNGSDSDSDLEMKREFDGLSLR